jgi:hypothetical protein
LHPHHRVEKIVPAANCSSAIDSFIRVLFSRIFFTVSSVSLYNKSANNNFSLNFSDQRTDKLDFLGPKLDEFIVKKKLDELVLIGLMTVPLVS